MVTAAYPAQYKDFGIDEVDDVDIVEAAHVNEIRAEVEAIQAELGLNPSGGSATVAAFLSSLNSGKFDAGDTILAASGSLANPGLGFDAEAGLGMMRVSAGVLALVTGAVERLRANGDGITVTDLEVTGSLTVGGSGSSGLNHSGLTNLAVDSHTQYSLASGARAFTGTVAGVTPTSANHLATKDYVDGAGTPAGTVAFTGRSSAPTGWLLCDGSEVSRSTYSALFSAIGTTFGSGNGSTTFDLPDLRGRFPLGRAASGTGSSLGSTGGSLSHTHSNSDTDSGGSHTHSNPSTSNTGSHTHSNPSSGSANGVEAGTTQNVDLYNYKVTGNRASHTHNISNTSSNGSHGHSQGNTGSAGSHSHTMSSTGSATPAYIALNAIIRT